MYQFKSILLNPSERKQQLLSGVMKKDRTKSKRQRMKEKA
jgi:hypothetical protein